MSLVDYTVLYIREAISRRKCKNMKTLLRNSLFVMVLATTGTLLAQQDQTARIGVRNITDRNYYYNAGFPEAGRTWFTNIRYSF